VGNRSWQEKLTNVQKVVHKTSRSAPPFSIILKKFCLEEVPIFNIWESVCWIYTCCSEPEEIKTDPEVECYLHGCWYLRYFGKPSGFRENSPRRPSYRRGANLRTILLIWSWDPTTNYSGIHHRLSTEMLQCATQQDVTAVCPPSTSNCQRLWRQYAVQNAVRWRNWECKDLRQGQYWSTTYLTNGAPSFGIRVHNK